MNLEAALVRIARQESPYPGLRPFDTPDAHLFFGRDRQISELVARLERDRLVAVVGVSGCGKSSLVRAGLIPALERGCLAERTQWRIVKIKPGDAPIGNLQDALSKQGFETGGLRRTSFGLAEIAVQLSESSSLLVVIDQFEELFRYRDRSNSEVRRKAASEAADFVQLLLTAVQRASPVFVVLTMRSDYLGECAEFRNLSEALNDTQYLVPRLTREQRKEVIEGPLGRTPIEPGLVQTILNECGDDPGSLPVMQHALMCTWQEWRSADPECLRAIGAADYQKAGKLGGALNQHGDRLLADSDEEVTGLVFKRLTFNNQNRRNPATVGELFEFCDATTEHRQRAVMGSINSFRAETATFLQPRDGTLSTETQIDITHESLIRHWNKLGSWVAQEREDARLLDSYIERSRGEKLAGIDLDNALNWNSIRNRTSAWANLHASEEKVKAVAEFIADSKRKRRRTRQLCFCLGGITLITLMFGLSLYYLRVQSLHESKAQLSALRAQSEFAKEELDEAGQLAVGSLEEFPTIDADHILRQAVALLPPHSSIAPDDVLYSATLDPRGENWVTGGEGFLRIFSNRPSQSAPEWMAQLRLPFNEPDKEHNRFVYLRYSPKGTYLGSIASQGLTSDLGAVRVLDRSGSLRRTIPGRRTNLNPPFVFSSDENWIVSAGRDSIEITNIVSGETRELQNTWGGTVRALAFAPESANGTPPASRNCPNCPRISYIAVAGDDSSVSTDSNAVDLSSIVPYSSGTAHGNIPDLARLNGDSLQVFEMPSGDKVALGPHGKRVAALAYSPDGRWVVTVGQEGAFLSEVFVERGKPARLPTRPIVEGLNLCCVVFNQARPGQFAVAGRDGSIRLFELNAEKTSVRAIEVETFKMPDRVNQIAFSPGGNYLAAAGESMVSLFNLHSGMEVSRSLHHESVQALDFGAETQVLAATDHGAKIFNPEAHERRRLESGSRVLSVAWSVTGAIATSADDRQVRLFQGVGIGNKRQQGMAQDQPPATLSEFKRAAVPLAFSSDGRFIASANDSIARVYDLKEHRVVFAAPSPLVPRIMAVALSGDGKYIALAGDNGAAILKMDHGVGKDSRTFCEAKDISLLSFSYDARFLALGGGDLQVCETRTGRRLSGFIAGNVGSGATTLEFSPTRPQLLVGTYRGEAAVLELNGESRPLLVNAHSVKCVAYSRDGTLIATGEIDGTVKVFDAGTLAPLAWITLDTKPPLALRFFPGGIGQNPLTLGTVSQGQTPGELIQEMHILQTKDLIADACSRLSQSKSAEKACPSAPPR